MIIALFVAPFLILSLGLIAVAWRGVPIDDHPLCRRCGFDLFGKPAGATRCSECGADLHRRRAIRIGHRRRRPWLLVLGLVLLMLIGGAIYLEIASIDWVKYAPMRLVIWRAESIIPAVRSRALAELDSRFRANAIGTGDSDRVADAGLVYQRDLRKPWDPRWGNLLEAMHAKGNLSAERWSRYLTQAADGAFALRLRSKVRHGEGFPYAIERRAIRAGTGASLQIFFDPSGLEWLSPHGSDPKTQQHLPVLTSLLGSGVVEVIKLEPTDLPEPIPDGMQQVHVHGTVKVGFLGNDRRVNPDATTEIDLPGSFTLLPATTPPAKINPHSADETEAVRKCVRLGQASLTTGSAPELQFSLSLNSSPLPMVVDVFVRANGQEYLVGGTGCQAHVSNPGSVMLHTPWATGNPGTVDIIVRNHPDWIGQVGDWDGEGGWQGEIVFKDVPVK